MSEVEKYGDPAIRFTLLQPSRHAEGWAVAVLDHTLGVRLASVYGATQSEATLRAAVVVQAFKDGAR